jgi:uncharacterized cupin superfamily protein
MNEFASQHPQFFVFRPADVPLYPVEGDEFSSMSAVWTSPDKSKKVGSYRIRKGGDPFEFHQRFHETTFILSGHMIVTLEDGTRFDLRPGDMAQVLPDTKCTVEIVETVHDFFVLTSIDGPVEV